MNYTDWEMGFESSRNGARLGQWSKDVDQLNVEQKQSDSWELGFESSRNRITHKKLSHCIVNNRPQIVLQDSDLIIWDR